MLLYSGVLAVLGLLLAAWPVQADPFDRLFEDDLSRFTDPTPLVNGPFIGVNTRLKVATALKKPKASHLVVSGGTVRDDPQDVTVNALVVKPGAPLIPWSVRQITIYGGDHKGVTVTRAPRVK
jgi:hypothetical protein